MPRRADENCALGDTYRKDSRTRSEEWNPNTRTQGKQGRRGARRCGWDGGVTRGGGGREVGGWGRRAGARRAQADDVLPSESASFYGARQRLDRADTSFGDRYRDLLCVNYCLSCLWSSLVPPLAWMTCSWRAGHLYIHYYAYAYMHTTPYSIHRPIHTSIHPPVLSCAGPAESHAQGHVSILALASHRPPSLLLELHLSSLLIIHPPTDSRPSRWLPVGPSSPSISV